MIRRDTIRADFETATRAVAENLSKAGHRIDVVFRGDSAYTDSKTIVLPGGDHTKVMTAEDQAIIAGYTDHEAAHLLYTDFEAYTKGHEESKGNPLLHEMANAIEDMRIEPQMIRNWPGTKDNLTSTTRAVNGELISDLDLSTKPIDMSDAKEWLPVAVTWEGRRRMGLDVESNTELLSRLSDEVLAKAVEIMDAVESLPEGRDGTVEAISLAKRYVDELVRLPKKGEKAGKERDKGKSTEDKEGAEGKGKGDDEAESKGKGKAEKDEGKSDDAKGDQPEAEAEGGDEEASDGEDVGESEADEDAVGESIKTRPVGLKPKALDTLKPAKGSRVDAFTQPVFHHRTMGPLMGYDVRVSSWGAMMDLSQRDELNSPYGDRRFQDDLNLLRGNVATMRAKLRRALMAKKDRVWLSGQTRGRFDTRRLVTALAGAHDIYQVRHDGEDIDTAITIMVDCSASMAGNEITLARQTAVALSSALEGTGVAYEVLGFTNRSTALNDAERDHLRALWPARGKVRVGMHGTLDRVHIYEFKRFDEPLREAKRAIGNIANVLLYENNDADSLYIAWQRIKKRREPRKIIMVLSDGYPSCQVHGTDSTAFLNEALTKMVKRVSDDGVQLIGIGIESSAAKRFYPLSEVVHRVSDLNGRVIDNVAKLLLGTRFAADNAKLGESHAA